ncbi:MAG: substrate-binding domain-containing protein, partial [Synergistaceae bacterium]|nr:substrate-binding domain-containing protein [Synergistaceae bacterium]
MKYSGYVFRTIATEVFTSFLTSFCAFFLFYSGYVDSSAFAAYCVAMISALWLGWRCATKNELPATFAKRYWPVLPPPLLLLVWVMFKFAFPRVHMDVAHNIAVLFYVYIPVVFSTVPFIASFLLSARRKKLESTKGLRFTCVVVVLAFTLPVWQVKRLYDNYLLIEYDGPTLADENYVVPLPELDFSPSLSLSEDLPRLDGATSFYPVYSTIARGIYRGNENWKDSLSLSRTEEAYNRLIRGETDLIFVLQPSDGQLRAARDAGVELRLTPIAKEAFVFFISERNPVSNLSIGQTQDIYMKKITNRKEVGGDNEKILPFQRPNNSGSQTA